MFNFLKRWRDKMLHRGRKPGESIAAWRRRKEAERKAALDRGDHDTASNIASALAGAIIGSALSSGSDSSSSSSSDWGSSSSGSDSGSYSGGGGDSGGGGADSSF